MKINFFKTAALAAVLSLCAWSCESEKEPASLLEESLGIKSYSPELVEGSAQVGRITFKAKEGAARSEVAISVTIDETTLTAQISFREESMELSGNGASLSRSQKADLLTTAQQLYAYTDSREGTLEYVEYSLIRMMEYWSNAPEGYRYNAVSVPSPYTDAELAGRLGNEGITCIRKGTTVTAEYDDSRGVRSERVVVGSKARSGYDCMGRCGADCGRWWIPSAWTKDCMDHDQCSNVNNSSGGASDSNCGDEFNEAADDWAFGIVRGCRG